MTTIGGALSVTENGLQILQHWSASSLDSVILLGVSCCHWNNYIYFSVVESSFRRFKGGVGPVLIDYISCTGKFWRSGCIHFTHPSGCSHDEDVGVQCQPGKNCYKLMQQISCVCVTVLL